MSKELKQIGDDVLASLSHLGPQKIDVSLGTKTWLNPVPILDNVTASNYFFQLSENILGNPSILSGEDHRFAPAPTNETSNLAQQGQEQVELKEAKFRNIKTSRVGSFGELARQLLSDKNKPSKENDSLLSGNNSGNFPSEEQVQDHANAMGEGNKDQPTDVDPKKEAVAENIAQEKKRYLIESNKKTALFYGAKDAVKLKDFTADNGPDKRDELAPLINNGHHAKTNSIGSFSKLTSDLSKNQTEAKISDRNPKEIGQKDTAENREEQVGLSKEKGSSTSYQNTKQQPVIIEDNFGEIAEEINPKQPFAGDFNTSPINNLLAMLKEVANKPDSAESLELVKVMTELLNAQAKSSPKIPEETVAISQNTASALGEKELFGFEETNTRTPFLKSSKITAQIDHAAFTKSKELRLSYRRFYGE